MKSGECYPGVIFRTAAEARTAVMRSLRLAAILTLAACGQGRQAPDTPGAKLEAAAVARGLVADPDGGSPVGSWAGESDRLCVVPAGDRLRVGALVDYGEGQGCAASGEATRRGNRLRIRFGPCRFEAQLDDERIAFPAELPPACDTVCTGRASLTAFSVARLSDSASEAATLRAPNGRALCGG